MGTPYYKAMLMASLAAAWEEGPFTGYRERHEWTGVKEADPERVKSEIRRKKQGKRRKRGKRN